MRPRVKVVGPNSKLFSVAAEPNEIKTFGRRLIAASGRVATARTRTDPKAATFGAKFQIPNSTHQEVAERGVKPTSGAGQSALDSLELAD